MCISSGEFRGDQRLPDVAGRDAAVGPGVLRGGRGRVDAAAVRVPLLGVHAVRLSGDLAQTAAERVDAGQRHGQPQQAVRHHRPHRGHILQRVLEIPLRTQHRRSVTHHARTSLFTSR